MAQLTSLKRNKNKCLLLAQPIPGTAKD